MKTPKNTLTRFITFAMSVSLLASCVSMRSSGHPKNEEVSKGESSPSTVEVVKGCAVTKYPEGILSFGIIAISSAPIAPVIAMAYYGSVLYQCQAAKPAEVGASIQIDAMRKELLTKIDKSKAESDREASSQIKELNDRLAAATSISAASLSSLAKSASEISKQAAAVIQRNADETIRAVYQHMDEVRNVKIQVIPDTED